MTIKAAPDSGRDVYLTQGGIAVHRQVEEIPVPGAIEPVVAALDHRKGVLLASSYEYPGRYTRWDMGFIDPPLEVVSQGREVRVTALNERGEVILRALKDEIRGLPAVRSCHASEREVVASVRQSEERFPEELRSKQPSVFSVLRVIVDLFHNESEPHLGLYGAFGYDLAMQFEPLRLNRQRPDDQRDLVLYLPDDIVIVDHRRERAMRRHYDFEVAGRSTEGLPRTGASASFAQADAPPLSCDHRPGEYAETVRQAREAFRLGNLFEVVPSQTFFEPCQPSPAELFGRLRERNPAPYGFLINLGQSEYLVGASPEMYVRVEGRRVETCPISGTIARGQDPISDAAQILELLNSAKDEAELTMCTDVDRNDKSRICEPGSVRVIGRRQIEMYSRVIHTVDHVEGQLREDFDALDAFLAHTWAVTVTGAPKAWAMQFIEDHEKSPRTWYGGAVGLIGFDGNMNTGLTLRTVRIKAGVAQVRVGATLLFDSDPEEEERETRIKASAMLDAVRQARPSGRPRPSLPLGVGLGKRVLLVDHQDSFVHTLANYFRQTGAEVVTLRAGFRAEEVDALAPDLIVLSPGPGRPCDFDVSRTLQVALDRDLPVFGVCLGLQGTIEHFGGKLGVLDYPMHGKTSRVRVVGGRLFSDMPEEFDVGRYHSLYGLREAVPPELEVTAETEDGVVMALEHRELPVAAVQFHPESIMTLDDDLGLRLIHNVVGRLTNPTVLTSPPQPSPSR